MFEGLSFSFCVADIVRGKVALEKVSKIIAATCCATQAAWDEVISQYKKVYWDFNPAECERIARQLLSQGKVEQPRLNGEEAHNIANGHWRQNGKQFRL